MLVLSRKARESIRIGDATVHVVRIRKTHVRLGITAPGGVRILRSELPPHVPDPLPADTSPSLFRVVLLDHGKIEVVHECESRFEANAWVEEWDRDHLGLVAVVWPAWAPLDLAATIGGASCCDC